MPGGSVDLRFTPEQESFRSQVRRWLADNVPTGPAPADGLALMHYQRAWQTRLAAESLVAVHWPTEYGGRGLGWFAAFIVQEEMALARAPEIANRAAINLVGPTLLEYGTADQKAKYLPGIVTAEEIWCQLFSEPEAGSDLGAMKSTATRVDGGWRVTGQKVWASNAQYARFGVLLARTGASSRGRNPIGYFLVNMDQPGIDVRPLRQMTGESEFNEVFLDSAFVADDDVVGDPHDGWSVMQTTLGYERSTSPRQLIVHSILLDELLAEARYAPADSTTTQGLARAYTELLIYRLHLYRVLSQLDAGGSPADLSSVVKLHWSEMAQRMHEVSFRMMGAAATAASAAAPPATPATFAASAAEQLAGANDPLARRRRNHLYYRACTIFAGTSEIQRNTIAERLLGLPREPRPRPQGDAA